MSELKVMQNRLSLGNLFNGPDLHRFFICTFICQKVGIADQALDFCIPGLPIYLVVDSRLPNISLSTADNVIVIATVDSEPSDDLVEMIVAQIAAKSFNLIAIGGGSTIDTCKAVWANAIYGTWKGIGYGNYRFSSDNTLKKPGRFIAIPTLPASGSEVSRYYLIKDSKTGVKRVGRSWILCPDVALLDPSILISAPTNTLIASSFDAFIHNWETFHCRHESSHLVRLLAADAINTIISSLNLFSSDKLDINLLASLQYSACVGGVCISNARTGLLHTAGEALSAQIDLPHPLTLYVFFRRVVGSYIHKSPLAIVDSENVLEFWERTFNRYELTKYIQCACLGKKIDLKRLMLSIEEDKVLISKEHPVDIPHIDHIEKIVVESLVAFSIEFV